MKLTAILPAVGAAVLLGAAAQPPAIFLGSFLPPNTMRIPMSTRVSGGITQAQFNHVMDHIQGLYGPIIAARGGRLVINRLWADDTVNASAERVGQDYVLNMYGGLARHPAITQDGMALVACHELGHHVGGAPKYGGNDWASNEGESDYFATTKCLHRVFLHTASQTFTRMAIPNDLVREACGRAYAGRRADQTACYRSSMAGLSVTALFSDLGGDPPARFETPDPSVVPQTYDGHPASQCRLDTYFQGALCVKPWQIDMNDADPAVGGCVASEGFTIGLRPRCWYRPPATEPATNVFASAPSRVPKTPAILASLRDGGVARAWTGL